MTFIKVIIAIAIVAFVVFVGYGLVKDLRALIKKRKLKKLEEKSKEEVSDKDGRSID